MTCAILQAGKKTWILDLDGFTWLSAMFIHRVEDDKLKNEQIGIKVTSILAYTTSHQRGPQRMKRQRVRSDTTRQTFPNLLKHPEFLRYFR